MGRHGLKVTRSYKYVVEDWDRHGNPRVYLRLPGKPKVRLRAEPGSPAFDAEYRLGLISQPLPTQKRLPPAVGSLRALCIGYYGSAECKRLDARTRHVRRLILDRLCEKHGDKPAALMEPRHVRAIRDAKADTPEAANSIVKALRAVFASGIENGICQRNPAREVPLLESLGEGFHTWTDAEVAQYEARHPIDTRARLALALLLYTGQRRADAVAFGPRHVVGDVLTFTQNKNRNRKPITLALPIIPALRDILAASPLGADSFLTTEFGRPFSAAGFGNRFRAWCNEAGLPHCSAHGLRKAAATRLAELGCSTNEIAAVTGHTTLKEVQRYTAAASQRVMAGSAMAKLEKSHFHVTAARWDENYPQDLDIIDVAGVMVPGASSQNPYNKLI